MLGSGVSSGGRMRRLIHNGLFILFLGFFISSARADEGYFNSNLVQIHYKVTGAGEPVVLIHGFSGPMATWNTLSESLSKRYRVISMDCRGHGKSGKPHE